MADNNSGQSDLVARIKTLEECLSMLIMLLMLFGSHKQKVKPQWEGGLSELYSTLTGVSTTVTSGPADTVSVETGTTQPAPILSTNEVSNA